MSFCMTIACEKKEPMNENEAKAHKRNFPTHDVVGMDKTEKEFERYEDEAGL